MATRMTKGGSGVAMFQEFLHMHIEIHDQATPINLQNDLLEYVQTHVKKQ